MLFGKHFQWMGRFQQSSFQRRPCKDIALLQNQLQRASQKIARHSQIPSVKEIRHDHIDIKALEVRVARRHWPWKTTTHSCPPPRIRSDVGIAVGKITIITLRCTTQPTNLQDVWNNNCEDFTSKVFMSKGFMEGILESMIFYHTPGLIGPIVAFKVEQSDQRLPVRPKPHHIETKPTHLVRQCVYVFIFIYICINQEK